MESKLYINGEQFAFAAWLRARIHRLRLQKPRQHGWGCTLCRSAWRKR